MVMDRLLHELQIVCCNSTGNQSNMAFLIRKAEFSDMETIYRLLQELSHYLPAPEMYQSIWSDFIGQRSVTALVAESDESENPRVVGFGSLCTEMKIRGGVMGHIEDIVVDTSFQRAGIGRLIVESLLAQAELAGCYKVSLECREDKKIFYQKLGFKHTGKAMSILFK